MIMRRRIIVAAFFIGLAAGYALPDFKGELNISYVSKAELLKLEKARLDGLELQDRQLFLGKPEEALRMVLEFQKAKTDGNNVMLITDSKIYGRNVKPASRELHEKIIRTLEEARIQDLKGRR
jgi:hypothetical protein